MGNLSILTKNCLHKDKDADKNIIIQNDIRIDDIISNILFTKLETKETDALIRNIISPNNHINVNLLENLIDEVCDSKKFEDERYFSKDFNYSALYKHFILNIIGNKFEYIKLLGLLILPYSYSITTVDKANAISKYIIDYYGCSINSFYSCMRHIIEMNTDFL